MRNDGHPERADRPDGRPDLPFVPARRRGGLARGLLGLTCALSLIGAVFDWYLVMGLAGIQNEAARRLQEGEGAGDVEKYLAESSILGFVALVLVTILRLLPLLPTGIAFLVWIHRAHRNLAALGARELRFSPWGAVGWFFVPVLHLVRPYQVVREIWTASDPHVVVSDAAARERAPVPGILRWWWGLWVASAAIGFYVVGPYNLTLALTYFVGKVGTVTIPVAAAVVVAVVGGLAYTTAAAMALEIVRDIDQRQQDKAISHQQ
jgi:hypothetical protein